MIYILSKRLTLSTQESDAFRERERTTEVSLFHFEIVCMSRLWTCKGYDYNIDSQKRNNQHSRENLNHKKIII